LCPSPLPRPSAITWNSRPGIGPACPSIKSREARTTSKRLPDDTKATVIELAQDGRWLKLTLPDGRTGWVTSSYISDMIQVPSTSTSPTGQQPQRIADGVVERVADGDTLTVITANQIKLRIRMFGILSRDRKTILSPSLPR